MKTGLIACFLLLLLFTAPAAPLAATVTMNWTGTMAMMPKEVEGSAYVTYGGKVFIFGGFTYDTEQNGTFIYDPSADLWTQGAVLPTARYYCAATEAGGKIYVLGGARFEGGSSQSLTVCEAYDPATNSWAVSQPLPVALRGHSAVMANGKIYVLGGKTGSAFNESVYEFDPGSNSWSAFSTAPFAAAYGGASFSASENRIYYMGGITSDTPVPASYLGKAYAMNATTGSWDAETFPMPFKTAHFALANDAAEGQVYLVGGTYNPGEESPYPDIQAFDSNYRVFQSGMLPVLPGPLSRVNGCASVTGGKLFLIGGSGVNSVDACTLASESWHQPNSPVSDGTEERYLPGGAAAAINNRLYLAGGGFFLPLTGEVLAYDPASNSWTSKSGVDPQPRTYAASGTHDGKIVVAGGMDGNANLLNTVVTYDPVSDDFTVASGHDPDPAIFSAGAVFNGNLYLFGGRTNPADQGSLSRKTRIFDISSGSFSAGPDLPYAIEQAAAATVGDRIYIFGGSTLTGPDYMNKNVVIFDPGSSSFTQGPAIPYPVYGPSVVSFGTSVLIDSGYYIFYSAKLDGFAGGPLSLVQVYDTQSATFSLIPRPYGKLNHNTAVIGTKFYSAAGEDSSWPSSRLDIANIISSGCSFTCTASATPESGAKPLEVNFSATAEGSGCSGSPAYSWTFGDGGSSTSQNPVHTYENDGSYDWSLIVTWSDQTCSKNGTVTVGGCQVSCEASLSATSGYAPFALNYSASSTATDCSSEVTYSWNFGDGSTSTDQSGTHTYTTPGTYTCTLTATADKTDCTKTATITVTEPGSCSVTCEASASPSSGNAPLSVNFTSTVTPTNCSGATSYFWNFGDEATSAEQNPVHVFSQAGIYNWSFTATVDGVTCSKTGSVTVGTASGPVVTSVSKAPSPFRLKVVGNGFENGAQVLVNGVPAPKTTFKSYSFLMAKKGAGLKSLCPKGVTVKITVKNPDGNVSNEFNYTR